MMHAGGAVAMAVATLLACCNADPHQEQDVRVGGHSPGDRYNDLNDWRQREELENFLSFLMQYENRDKNFRGNSGNTLGRNFKTYAVNSLRAPAGGIGGSSLGRNLFERKNANGVGELPILEKDTEDKMQYARFVDSLGGGNFVRNLESLDGGYLARNLDSIGGANFVKKNLDQIGGPNLVKRNLDSLGGGNLVRNLDSIGGGNFVRQVDPLGGGNFV